jgi:hypothetical protein
MSEQQKSIILQLPAAGTVWVAAWMFTIGVADLGFWKGALALLVWPYFLGDVAR